MVAQMLNLNQSVALTVSTDASHYTQDNVPARDLCLINTLIDTGAVSVLPATSGPPWWQLTPKPDAAMAGGARADFGARKVKKIYNTKGWKDGPRAYFSESIDYVVGGSKLFGGREFGPFTIRPVFVNDPAVGEWRLDSLGTVSGNLNMSNPDGPEAAEIFSSFYRGGCNQAPLSQRRLNAQQAAFDLVTENIKTTLAATPASRDVLVSKANNLAYYKGFAQGYPEMNLNMARSYCDGVRVKGFKAWRVASANDIGLLNAGGRLLDAPDGRLWGEFVSNTPSNGSEIITSTLEMNGIQFSFYAMPNPVYWSVVKSYRIYQGQLSTEGGSININGLPVGAEGLMAGPISHGVNENLKLLCVTNLS